jgi:hypothetical protein
MTLKQHLLATGVVVAAMAPFSGVAEMAIFSAGSILIDVDHYFFYVQRSRRWDVGGMFSYFRSVDKNLMKIPYLGVCIFHTADFFLIVAIISAFFHPLIYLFCGLLFHLLLDIVDMVRLKCPFLRAYSLAEHLLRRKTPGYPFI